MLLNRVKENTVTTGTGTITLAGSAAVGYRTFAGAGAATGGVYHYLIEDGTAWELGRGVYNAGAGTLTRTLTSSSTGALLNLSGSATVAVVQDKRAIQTMRALPVAKPLAADFPTWVNQGTSTMTDGNSGLIIKPQPDQMLHNVIQVAPTPPFSLYVQREALIWSNAANTVQLFNIGGPVLYNSGNGRFLQFGFGTERLSGDEQPLWYLRADRWTSATVAPTAAYTWFWHSAPNYMRLDVTATQVQPYVSDNGFDYEQMGAVELFSTHLVAMTHIGIGERSNTQNFTRALYYSWSLTAPAQD